MEILSLFYPTRFPSSLTQELVFTTEPGHSIMLNLLAIVVNNVENDSKGCENTFLKVIDTSLSAEGSTKKTLTCAAVDAESNELAMSYTTFLNSLKVILSNGFHSNDHLGLSYIGNITTVEGKLS